MDDAGKRDQSPFPMRRACPFDPPPEYARLRAEAPVRKMAIPGGATAWLVSRHEDVRTVLTDPRFSADMTHPGFPSTTPELLPSQREHRSFIRMDPPQHSRYRKALIPAFTVKRIAAMRPGIQSVVDGFIDRLLATSSPVDLVEAFAMPVPSMVICQLLGVPYADHDFFQERTRTLVSATSTPEQVTAAMQDLHNYLDELIGRKLRAPADDLLGRLVTQHLEPAGELTREDLLMTCRLLLAAGHETTANMIALGTVVLLEHPDQLALLRSEARLLPNVVEELLRYLSIADYFPARLAVEDVEIGGELIRAGEGVFPLLAAANWDPAVFRDPHELDIRRGTRRHLAFGNGVHQCLGQNLARLELEIVFTTLFERIPGLRLAAPADTLPYKRDSLIYGVEKLPVTW
ncbi:cytochrome P450 [Nonomuraea fuscirosea]|uniref:cytochrome P450 n=1 Tax=Nonomuraea fuscirosea TaxID=1291556 RepID=UPI0034191408